jgi:hypothetical protein
MFHLFGLREANQHLFQELDKACETSGLYRQSWLAQKMVRFLIIGSIATVISALRIGAEFVSQACKAVNTTMNDWYDYLFECEDQRLSFRAIAAVLESAND